MAQVERVWPNMQSLAADPALVSSALVHMYFMSVWHLCSMSNLLHAIAITMQKYADMTNFQLKFITVTFSGAGSKG